MNIPEDTSTDESGAATVYGGAASELRQGGDNVYIPGPYFNSDPAWTRLWLASIGAREVLIVDSQSQPTPEIVDSALQKLHPDEILLAWGRFPGSYFLDEVEVLAILRTVEDLNHLVEAHLSVRTLSTVKLAEIEERIKEADKK